MKRKTMPLKQFKWYISKGFLWFFCVYIKMVNKYYQKNKQKFEKGEQERYQNLSAEEKEKK